MITYILNFTLCTGLLLLTYQLLLKNTTLYRFNRAFLILSLLFSLIVPAITIHEKPIVAIEPVIKELTPTGAAIVDIIPQQTLLPHEKKGVDTFKNEMRIWFLIYLFVTVLMMCRLVYNLYGMRLLVSRHKHLPFQGARVVLIHQNILPFSFLNFLFVSQDEYENKTVDPVILAHEMAHIRQYHSLDIIFIELLKSVSWFNPFLIGYSRYIRMNHEFLADETVVRRHTDIVAYQNLLISAVSRMQSPSFGSQFSYSITKKRLIMMTKKTSSLTAWLTQTAILPIFVIAFVLFSGKSGAAQKLLKQDSSSVIPNKQRLHKVTVTTNGVTQMMGRKGYPSAKTDASESLMTAYAAILNKYAESNNPHNFRAESITELDRAKLEMLFRQMSTKQQLHQSIGFMLPPKKLPLTHPTSEQLISWRNEVRTYGLWVDGKHVSNDEVAKYGPEDFDQVFISKLSPNAINYKNYHYQVDLMTKVKYQEYISLPQDRYWMYYMTQSPRSTSRYHVINRKGQSKDCD